MTSKEVFEILESATWTFAKSMPKIPHSYTLLRKWENKELWFKVVEHMKNNSKSEYFYNTKYNYFYYGEYKYWTMDPTIESTDLINKTRI